MFWRPPAEQQIHGLKSPFVIHGTPVHRVPSILQNGIVLPANRTQDEDDKDMLSEHVNVPVFAQLLFKNVNSEKMAWWHACALVLDPSLLDELPFKALKGNGGWHDPEENVITDDKEKLNLVQAHIDQVMTGKNPSKAMKYQHSHELIFNVDIPAKYIIAVLTRKLEFVDGAQDIEVIRNALKENNMEHVPILPVDLLTITPKEVYELIEEETTPKTGGGKGTVSAAMLGLSCVVLAMSVLGSLYNN